jgi:hypothetical protein
MGKSSGSTQVQQPSAAQMTSAQTAANKEAAVANAKLSAIDQYGPYGSVTYQRRDDGTPESVTTTLTPTAQATVDQQQQIASQLTDQAQQAVGWLPQTQLSYDGIAYDPNNVDTSALQTFNPTSYTPQTMSAANYQVQQFGGAQGQAPTNLDSGSYKFSQLQAPGQAPTSANIWGQGEGEANLSYDPRNYGDISQIDQTAADSVYNAGKARLDPQFQQQQDDMMQMLSDRGIPLDSKAAQTVMSNMARNQSDAYAQLANESYMAGHQVAGDNINTEQSLRATALSEQSLARDWANQDYTRDYNIASDLNQQNNAVTQQQLAADSSIWGLNNTAYQRDFDMGLQTNQAQNQNTASQYAIDTGIHDQQNSDYMMGFNNQLTTVNQQNQDWLTKLQTEQNLRSSSINESTNLRNSAINDVSMYLQGAPAINNPTTVSTPQYNQATTDAMGAQLAQYNAQLNAQNAAQQRQSSMWNAIGQGAGTAAALWLKSSKRLKDHLGDADTFLGRVKKLRIQTWRYTGGAQRQFDLDGEVHLGPFAEEFAALFGGPPDEINMGDAIFILWRAVQELAQDVADACDNRPAVTV